MPERKTLRQRCDQRLDAMMAAGALEEARALAALGLDPGLPAMRALGVPPLLAHLRGELALAAAVEQAKAETRQYAKRQVTWLRRNMIAWKRLGAQESVNSLREALAFIRD
jgi:tRNA dimethylallyltransferase